MPAEAWEEPGREINDSENPSARTRWCVTGATSYANARAALDAALPTSFTFPSGSVAYLDGVDAEEQRDDEFFKFIISYESQPRQIANETEFEFDVSAPNELIFQSYSTATYSAAGLTAPSRNGAINLPFGESQPRGMRPYNPFSTFSITKHFPLATVTQAFQLTIESLVGAINSATFQGRAAGTVRFLGARGRQSGNKFPISYEFGFRPNLSSFSVGSITVPSAYGWDLLDVLHYPAKDATAKQIIPSPHTVFVHRVHATSTLAGLAL